MTELNNAIEDTVFLTGFDVIQKRGIPEVEVVGLNAGGSFLYEYLGKKLVDLLGDRILPNYKKELMVVGKIIGIPLLIGILQQYVLMKKERPKWGGLFLKGLVGIGAQSVWRSVM